MSAIISGQNKSICHFFFSPIHFVGNGDRFILFVFIYSYWCPTLFSYNKMFVKSMGGTCGVETSFSTRSP